MQGDGTEWIDENLPIPNYIEFTNTGYCFAWHINGYFGTKKGIEYLNDIIGRVLITFKENKPNRLIWKPDLKTADHYYPKIYKLADLQNLRSIPGRKKAPTRADSFADHTFWAIKLHTEDRIREFGEGNIIAYEPIEDWAMSQFIDKEKSTIRAKCRSIWNWYNNKNWELPKLYQKKYSKEELEMSRTEHIKKVNENRKIQTRNKIKAVLDDIFMQDKIKKKNGKLKITAIAKLSGVHRETVAEHLKEMGLK